MENIPLRNNLSIWYVEFEAGGRDKAETNARLIPFSIWQKLFPVNVSVLRTRSKDTARSNYAHQTFRTKRQIRKLLSGARRDADIKQIGKILRVVDWALYEASFITFDRPTIFEGILKRTFSVAKRTSRGISSRTRYKIAFCIASPRLKTKFPAGEKLSAAIFFMNY